MDARKKISRGATAARLRFLSALLAVCSAALFSAFVPSAIFLRGLAGRAFAAACFLGGTGLLAWCLFFVVMLVSMMKRAGRYAFAVTESAQYECFGPFLAMNVRFSMGRDGRGRGAAGSYSGYGTRRRGRTFLWKLPICPETGRRRETENRERRGNRTSSPTRSSSFSAPRRRGKFPPKKGKSEKMRAKTLAKREKIVYNNH